jgi:hypothetical protein
MHERGENYVWNLSETEGTGSFVRPKRTRKDNIKMDVGCERSYGLDLCGSGYSVPNIMAEDLAVLFRTGEVQS